MLLTLTTTHQPATELGFLLHKHPDKRLAGFDAAAVIEVIEHIDPPRLGAFADAVFGVARPHRIVLTTPNAEYNARYETLGAEELRHDDHRFEWSRAEFRFWAEKTAEHYGYDVAIDAIGDADPELGKLCKRGRWATAIVIH